MHSVRGSPPQVRNIIQASYESRLREKTNLPESFFPLTEKLVVFGAEEALSYGFIDTIVNRKETSDKLDAGHD